VAAAKGESVEFINQSGVEAGWTLGFERDGRELLIVAVKATYNLPLNGQDPILAEEQAKLTKADEFTGEPGRSAPLRETDYSPKKLRCDVILNGSAYAPGGFPASAVEVSLRVGSMRKSFSVFGDRRWNDIMLSTSYPEPFTQMPISYDHAYGGADYNEDQPDKVSTYPENPVGVGYHPIRRRFDLLGKRLPNTAEGSNPISDVTGRYRPMSFGPVGRNFSPRYKHAGTYDQHWLDHEAPYWPADFSYAYFQCAPDDQQLPFLEGGEEVELKNLTANARLWFKIPRRRIPVTCISQKGSDVQVETVCDTLLLEPDLSRFSLTWRASIPLQRNLFELRKTVVGELPRSWYAKRRAELAGKRYYSSLAEAVAARGGRRS
jgi:hypothetical protein